MDKYGTHIQWDLIEGKKEIMKFSSTQMEREKIRLTKTTSIQKDKYSISPPV